MNAWLRVTAIALAFLIAPLLTGCVPQALHHNTTGVIGTIYDLRREQVLTNISAAIDNVTNLPVHVVITQGSAQVSGSITPGIKLPHMNLSEASKELDVSGTYQWTDQWQFIPVTAPDDLQRLRTLYGAIVRRTTDAKANAVAARTSLDGFPKPPTVKSPFVAPPPTEGEAAKALDEGISPECRTYLAATPSRVWLYWKNADAGNLPVPAGAASLGSFGRNELFTTSMACFDDFILLVQSTTTATQTQAIGLSGASSILINP